ncbi:MAG: helix-turn-helix domain-containing protein [Deltaproteobacteria bacterium]|nr:helix-turn-helix domain-containing protein [Deltaproteobacteria bacterium]
MVTTAMDRTFGGSLRRWRAARGMSQERLAEAAEVSTRHLSFLETGRSQPSREMVLVLANALDLPLRERNGLLSDAGFAAVYREAAWGSSAMQPIERALDHLLATHEPFGAIVVDRHWNVRRMNAGAIRMFSYFWPPDVAMPTNLAAAVFAPPARSIIVGWERVAAVLVPRFLREAAAEPELLAMLETILAAPDVPESVRKPRWDAPLEPTLVIELRRGDVTARFFTTITTLGTPLDVTAESVRIESYFPADAATDAWVRALATQR